MAYAPGHVYCSAYFRAEFTAASVTSFGFRQAGKLV
ncbi:MAG: hypothetical protein AB7J28_03205 [Hyphomonadaceae bacterium]